jgi:hypothetical protein
LPTRAPAATGEGAGTALAAATAGDGDGPAATAGDGDGPAATTGDGDGPAAALGEAAALAPGDAAAAGAGVLGGLVLPAVGASVTVIGWGWLWQAARRPAPLTANQWPKAMRKRRRSGCMTLP